MKNCPSYDIVHTIGEEHLQRLLSYGRPASETLAAYQWELALRQAFLKPVGIVEVSVRNAIDRAIRGWWVNHGYTGMWTDEQAPSLCPVLSPFVHPAEWRKRAAKNISNPSRAINHDDIIAHTCFGTWRNMIGNPASLRHRPPSNPQNLASWNAARTRDARCAELWASIIKTAFSHIPTTKRERGGLSPRAFIGSRLSRIGALRNRICHWDNLLTVNIPERYKDMAEVVNAVNVPTAVWLHNQCDNEVEVILSQRPQWLTEQPPT